MGANNYAQDVNPKGSNKPRFESHQKIETDDDVSDDADFDDTDEHLIRASNNRSGTGEHRNEQ